ncbi:signal peptidase I [Treponema zuelzerae]|uniref:Signal peptidase I n=1 Tax=Teretinema zuelzerae TaxID=156 RepID=A0AAE3JHW2_9SPIR|nr:signal peptidase I [Teretinema zuelzerae]MBN2811401.1 signal peptidase I [Spirochaetales bacterium]MCD1653456.1 signal peptidase I [Teretinema zuelzerae]
MKSLRSRALYFFTVVLIALFCKLFVVDVMYVSGPSMEPALVHGNLVLEYKLAWGIPLPFANRYLMRWGEPIEDDVVIYPWNGRYVIKRCAGTPGTSLVFSPDSGYSVDIRKRIVPLTEEQYLKLHQTKEIPPGTIFALGDNLDYSRDSRDYGFVALDSIRGKVLWK